MKLTVPTLTAAVATLGVAVGPAQADQTHSPDTRFTHVSAYYNDVFATVQQSRRSYSIARIENGGHSVLPIPSSRHPYVTDVGSTADGRTLVVYSRAERRGDHDLYAFDLRTQRERKLPGSRRGTDERLPSMYAGQLVFFRSGAGKRSGIYYIAPIGPDKGKERLVWRTPVARSTDIEDDEIAFETDVRVGSRKANGIYAVREDSRRPRLVAVTRDSRTVVSSASISGGYLTYLRYDANREPQHTVERRLVDGLATDLRRTTRPTDATQVAIGGPRLFFIRSGVTGVHEVTASQWAGG